MSPISAPELASSRQQARKLFVDLPQNLADHDLVVDCTRLKAGTPSFVDELVRVALVERSAARLTLLRAAERTMELARRAAANRKVADRLATVA